MILAVPCNKLQAPCQAPWPPFPTLHVGAVLVLGGRVGQTRPLRVHALLPREAHVGAHGGGTRGVVGVLGLHGHLAGCPPQVRGLGLQMKEVVGLSLAFPGLEGLLQRIKYLKKKIHQTWK